jgi:hypothetical protein
MPQNVLYDPYNTPVLIDFGVAPTPTQESFVTNTGFAVDVGRYMSPEQARGGEQDARSDIYSLGALTFLGLTGRPPYDGADGFAIAYAHVFEPIPRLPAAKAHWQPLIDCALAKDPKDRYASIEEFLDALTNVGLERDVALSVAPLPPAAVLADPAPAAPVAPVPVKVPEAIVIPEREPPAAVLPAKVAAKQSGAPAKVPAPTSGLTRFWPLAVAALGLVLIAAALLLPKGTPESAMAPAPATAVTPPPPSAPASPSAAPATAGVVPKATDTGQSASPAEAAATPAGSAASAAAGTTDTASADAGRLPVLDAAEAQLEADAADPAKAPTVVDPLPESIRLGRIDLAGQRLIAPPGKNALERFQFALSLDPRIVAGEAGHCGYCEKYNELADKAGGDKASAARRLMRTPNNHAADVAKLVRRR